MKNLYILGLLCACCYGCTRPTPSSETNVIAQDTSSFPKKLVAFDDYEKNPVFAGTSKPTWDEKIRERGYILKEDSLYHLWYTGYSGEKDPEMHLGYATSPDGIVWTRYAGNPIYDAGWVEDMMVIKSGDTYYMFAEGEGDIAHLMTSTDRIHWNEHGALDVRSTDGKPLSKGAYGTPAAWYEGGVWYLFYERGDLGIWLATSTDLKIWTNKQDDPVITMGPEVYDAFGLAVNQIVKHNGKYYAYYHATDDKDWTSWTSNVAMSDDLIHWKKYPGNPILRNNQSSSITVFDGKQLRLYSMHENVNVHFPR